VPTSILHGDDDQIVPIGAAALALSKLVKDATLKVYQGTPHGLTDTHKDQLNADLLDFLGLYHIPFTVDPVGSCGFSQGLLVGSKQVNSRTPPTSFTCWLCPLTYSRSSWLLCQLALSQITSSLRPPSANTSRTPDTATIRLSGAKAQQNLSRFLLNRSIAGQRSFPALTINN
jgi:hypothetical protein